HPVPDGKGEAHVPNIRLAAVPTGLSNVDANFKMHGDTITLTWLEGEMGEMSKGLASATGAIHLSGVIPAYLDLRSTVKDVDIAYPEKVHSNFSGSFHIFGEPLAPTIEGSVEVNKC